MNSFLALALATSLIPETLAPVPLPTPVSASEVSPAPPGAALADDPVAEATRTFLATGAAPQLRSPAAELYPFGHSTPVVRCAPLAVCDIELEPGEVVLDVATGDSSRWIIDQMTSGPAERSSPHVVVKPVDFNLSTNLLIATNRRTYTILLVSPRSEERPESVARRVAFWYPDDLVRHLRDAEAVQAAAAARSAEASASVLEVTDPTQLNYRYSVRPHHRAAPLRVLDDGERTYIQLPANASRQETPALVAIFADGTSHLLNYRVRNDWFVVDGTFDRAELLLGSGRRQTKISITNEARR